MRAARALVAGAALTAALAAVPGAPLAAREPAHTITVTPGSARPGDAFAVTGSVPGCAGAPYFVDITYAYYGESRFAQVEGTTDAEGGYSTSVPVPEQAWAGAGSIQGHAQCPDGPAYSNTVAVDIVPHAGALTVTPASAPAGTRVALHGTNCWGPEIRLAFRGQGLDQGIYEGIRRTPGPSPNEFTATYVIPAAARPGEYAFVASCPGTAYPPAELTVVGAAAPPAAPPATPVPAEPGFTG
ncbi:MAG TPA: hypothetical protein VGX28_00855 [Frankiaceae bacterium]|nr:hypothetical protein [Frankiaceae bacterium]